MSDELQVAQSRTLSLAQRSNKKYAVAVALSAVFGLLGIHHFYLKRWGEGILDLGLSAAWIYAFSLGHAGAAIGFFLLDLIHTVVVTSLLLVGKFKDGEGKLVTYPGQQL